MAVKGWGMGRGLAKAGKEKNLQKGETKIFSLGSCSILQQGTKEGWSAYVYIFTASDIAYG
jgi:hypothetical protein